MAAGAYAVAYGMAAILGAIMWAGLVGVSALQIIAQWKILQKTGEPGWKCLVPFLNGHTLFKKFWKPVYYWLMVAFSTVFSAVATYGSLVLNNTTNMTAATVGMAGLMLLLVTAYSVFAIVWKVKYYLGMARSFGYGSGFAVGLFFLPMIFQLILAFNKDAYQGNTYVASPQSEQQEL